MRCPQYIKDMLMRRAKYAEEFTTIGTMILYSIGFLNLVRLCYPFNAIRIGCLAISLVLIIGANLVMPQFFGMSDYTLKVIIVWLICVIVSGLLLIFVPMIKNAIVKKFKPKKQQTSS